MIVKHVKMNSVFLICGSDFCGISHFWEWQPCLSLYGAIWPGRIKALLLRRHSDWFGERFGELRLPHCSGRNKTRRNRLIHIWIRLLRRVLLRGDVDVAAIEHAAIDKSRRLSLLWRVFYPRCIVNFSN